MWFNCVNYILYVFSSKASKNSPIQSFIKKIIRGLILKTETLKKMNPQPIGPILAFFWGNDDGDESRWYYQYPKETYPRFVFNKKMPFEDPNQPGRPGDLYEDKIIEKVAIKNIDGSYYWHIKFSD